MAALSSDRFFPWSGGKPGSIGWIRTCHHGHSDGGENSYQEL